MNKTQAKDRVAKLRELINEYRYEYHVNNRSIMSEPAADGLKHELSELEAQYPDLITPDSPTQRVAGEPLPQFVSVLHKRPMLSLNDVFDQQELEAWEKRIQKLLPGAKLEYFVDIKMDGLACALVYQDGVLVQALTRGNGTTGEDITANVRTLESVPLRLRGQTLQSRLFLQGRTEVRGEIVMYKKDFEALNKAREAKGLPMFANPRNLAAGTVRQLDPRLVVGRPLHFRVWDLQRDDPGEVSTNEFAYQTLRELGFLVNDAKVLPNIKAVEKHAKYWEDRRHNLPFNNDGMVVKVNDRKVFDQLGVVGKAPRGAVAFKYPAEQATTKVKDIFVSIGRTGAATPVAVLEPVVVAGSTVQMATLHNEGEVRRKDVRIGDTIIVHKAGDIIPEVVEPLKSLRTGREKQFAMPKNCPECGTPLTKVKAEEAVWRCPNNQCPARVHNQIGHYASKAALDIEGLGEKNVLALLDAKLISDPADLYALTKEQLLTLDRFAEISAAKLVKSIQQKKNPNLSRFVYGLGIRHVGAQTAVDLANHFGSLDKIRTATVDDLHEVEGVGVVVAESIVAWFADDQHQQLLAKFANLGVEPQKVQKTDGPLKGKGFVITGTLSGMEREEAGDKIRALGGTFQSSVGKNTDYLVLGDNPGQGKVTKAEKLGTKIIDESEFKKILGWRNG